MPAIKDDEDPRGVVPLHTEWDNGLIELLEGHCMRPQQEIYQLDTIESNLKLGREYDPKRLDRIPTLHVAIRHCDFNLLRLLLDYGAPVDLIPPDCAETPIRYAEKCSLEGTAEQREVLRNMLGLMHKRLQEKNTALAAISIPVNSALSDTVVLTKENVQPRKDVPFTVTLPSQYAFNCSVTVTVTAFTKHGEPYEHTGLVYCAIETTAKTLDYRWVVPIVDNTHPAIHWSSVPCGVVYIVVFPNERWDKVTVTTVSGKPVCRKDDLRQPWRICTYPHYSLEEQEELRKWFEKFRIKLYVEGPSFMRDEDGMTPLMCAARAVPACHIRFIQLLLSFDFRKFTDVNAVDHYHRTALHHLCMSVRFNGLAAVPVLDALFKAGIDTSVQDHRGDTAAHMLAMLPMEADEKAIHQMYDRLIHECPDLLVMRNSRGQVPYDTAIEHKNYSTIEYLRVQGKIKHEL